ncbi:MAG TPA: ABC transporter permease [Ktedonobacteraceae bacterium]|nr:ABC transporter permease [Ktedonobacteraceae bacterium]
MKKVSVSVSPVLSAFDDTNISFWHRSGIALTAFLAILRRDIVVTRRDSIDFLTQALLQSLFFLFIFGKLLPLVGIAQQNFVSVLLPGIVVLTVVIAAMQSVSLPMVLDLGYAREIDDRLLAPLPIIMVGIEKVVFASLRGIIAGVLVFPFAYLILGDQYHVSLNAIGLIAGILLLSAFVGASMGIMVGTLVKASKVSLMFALIFIPLTFTGCTYYQWGTLAPLRWFQIATLFNPLTYASEGMRYAMSPTLHSALFAKLGIGGAFLELGAIGALCFGLGLWAFHRRVVL